METFSALPALLRGEFTGHRWIILLDQWRGALIFSLICAWMNRLVNNSEAGDLRRHRDHYDVIVLLQVFILKTLHSKAVALLQWRGVTLEWPHNGQDSVSNHQPHDCLLRHRSKKTSKLRVTGLCARNSPGTGKFPAQRASNAENVSIWWRHHDHWGIWITWIHCKHDYITITTHNTKKCAYFKEPTIKKANVSFLHWQILFFVNISISL